ncbi:MAG: M23 family metallopeptidase [Chloroflexota bacterium]|nr:MAG: M23 family metallopeptidase [Chloroflexota bacterium]
MLNRGFVCALCGALLLAATLIYAAPTVSHAAQIDLPVATYVVQRNDTLKAIAAGYGVSVGSILALNDITDPDSLVVGQELLVPRWGFGVSAPVVTPMPTDAPTTAYDEADSERKGSGASSRGGTRFDIDLVWPVSGQISQYFMEEGRHKGIDISTGQGTPVVAAKSGDVQFAGFDYSGYGNLVILSHPDGSSTLYAHLSRFAVEAGDYLEQGQLVGYVGSTGIATGPHLHFEVRQSGRLTDPLSVLP